jgi:hypothetical protein
MRWFVSTKDIDEIVEASDQWEAFNSLKGRSPDEFGLVVEVQPVRETSEAAIAVRTSKLFGLWGDPVIAKQFIEAAIALGLPDTTKEDL